MKYKFSEIVDISKLQKLMEGLFLLTNFSSGIVDNEENLIVAVGFREICMKYHRAHRETELLCRQSDAYVKEYIKVQQSKPYEQQESCIHYKCAHGLMDAAVPIIIDGEHLATILLGQVFLEEPDIEQFRRQAAKYSFNEEEYIQLVAAVPVYSKEKMDSIMHCYRQLAEMLAEMGLTRIRLAEFHDKSLRESEDKEQFEKNLFRLEQLNLIGEMAAGIGHEVRNPMTAVRGFLQILYNRNYSRQDKEYFNIMIQELDRANSIISEFLSLAKDKAITLEKKNLNTVITALSPLIEANTIIFNQILKLELGEIPELIFDEKEIRQLILNLARNAIEAMPERGSLTIRTFADGDDVVLEVQDQGEGIKPELMDKIGTPFFSTKDDGTGLGLPVCYRIAARHNAKLSVASANGTTTFSIRFKNRKHIK